MSGEIEFRLALVEAAAAVMRCEYCLSHAPQGDLPQPGWVGSRYIPGRGVVVLLQNPGAAPTDYGTGREASVQKLLREFAENPSDETHSRLMRFMLADMAGANGGSPWAKWTHPVSKLVPDQERLAWMNVVKVRTPGKTRKDDPPTIDAARHGVSGHLQREFDILKPRGVVTIGNEARSALAELRLPTTTVLGHLKLQGASTEEARVLRLQFLNAGVDI